MCKSTAVQQKHRGARHGINLLAMTWLLACVSTGLWLIFGVGTSPIPHPHSAAQRYITKNIEDVRANDYVLAKDPTDVAPPTPHRVLSISRHWTDHLVQIEFSDGDKLSTTREHPFWVPGRGWVFAKDLNIADRLENNNGNSLQISKLTSDEKRADTFNFIVDGVHTYYVAAGRSCVLVHNGTGSYTITFSNGMQYVGKGDRARAAASAARIAAQHNITPTNIQWSPANSNEESFVQEEYRMRNAGGPGGNTYNQINSPGSRIADDLGCP